MISWDSNDVCASVSISTFVFVFTLSIDYLFYIHNIILFESNIYFRINERNEKKRPNQRQTTTTVFVFFLIEKKTIDRIIKFFDSILLFYSLSSLFFNSIKTTICFKFEALYYYWQYFFIILKHNESSNRFNSSI